MTIQAPPAAVLLKELIPAELHDREYLKSWLDKPMDKDTAGEVFKKLDNAQTLVGKKTGIPGADAKPDELDKFYAGLRPGKADEYEFPAPKDAKAKVDTEFQTALRESFHEAGISKYQAAKFTAKMGSVIEARGQAAIAAQAKLDAEFETIVKAAFGEQNKAVLARGNKAIAEFTPATLKPFVDKLDNNALAILTGVIDGLLKKYAPEDELKPDGQGTGGDGNEGKRAEAQKLMRTPEYKDTFHAKHAETVAKVQQLYKEYEAGKKK